MILGPVFRSELMRTARRKRYYILRFVYGAVLLAPFWNAYEGTFAGANTAKTAAGTRFAEGTIFVFALLQLVTVIVLIPPLFGGAIADEKQWKTLHHLMASQLIERRDRGGQDAGAVAASGRLYRDGPAGGQHSRLDRRRVGRIPGRSVCWNGLDGRIRGGADGPCVDACQGGAAIGSDRVCRLVDLAVRAHIHRRDGIAVVPHGVPLGTLLLIGVYVAAASILTWHSVARFDRWLDRPKLSASG